MKKLWISCLLALVAFSCNQPACSNNNEILKDGDKDTWTYQNELMRLIEENPSGIDYYFERRAEVSGESFIVINVHGQGFCGELKTKSVIKNLESIKLQNNKGYRGAKLIGVGLKKVKLENGHEVFALEQLEKIND